MSGIDSGIVQLLDSEATRINSPEFIVSDPVQFPRRFSNLRDIEITALLSALLAWGNRTMICRDCERLLGYMDHDPYNYVMDEGYEDFPADKNIHRTFFGRDLQYFLRGLRLAYLNHHSLDEMNAASGVGETEMPAWRFAALLQNFMSEANEGRKCPQCIPGNLDASALKRFNMALRWLVRDDGIVDMGVWKSIPKSRLFIPLDVHVGNISRNLGLLERRSNDRKAVVQLTEVLKKIRPEDPVFYDFALFGLGIEGFGKLGPDGLDSGEKG